VHQDLEVLVTRFSKQASKIGCFRRTIPSLNVENSNDNFDSICFKNYGFISNKSLLVSGSIPGPCKRIVLIRRPFRK